jgi:hypothetical protein
MLVTQHKVKDCKMVDFILCAEATADGDYAFKVDTKETFDALVAMETASINEAEFWGGMRYDVAADDAEPLDDPDGAPEVTAEKLKESEKYTDLEARYRWLMGEEVIEE